MTRTTIKLKVIQDTCLGHTVFRGSAPAKDIVEAAWIDFHDPDQNPLGYQRAFNKMRSERARIYAEGTPNAFWPESILAIRRDDDLLEEEEIKWRFTPDSPANGQYGTLDVTYTHELTSNINGEIVPWRRALLSGRLPTSAGFDAQFRHAHHLLRDSGNQSAPGGNIISSYQ